MCNNGIEFSSKSGNQLDQEQRNQVVLGMDNPSAATVDLAPSSTPNSNEENPRVKFLCSFLGSILPRPQDGKLRYVGGETRIVSVPRDIMYEDLMGRMKELYEGSAVLKYQQPDEDLDALVSVVNDDDVTNMMEEYDKLGSGDGFTRLRIFLFSQPDQDVSAHFVDGDDKDTERRYVDALNNLNDASDLRKQQTNEYDSPESHIADHFISMNLDGSLHSQRNFDLPLPPFNLHHLNIPQQGLAHHQPIPQRYNEMEAPWSPAYYSPRHHGHHDPRPSAEFPSSPSSARYHVPFGGEMPEEYGRPQVNQQSLYEHQPQFNENVVWLPNGTVPGDKSGFPGNILHGLGHNPFEGNSRCEHNQINFQRNQPQLEQPNIGSGYHHVANPCTECPPNRNTFMVNTDANIHNGSYPTDQSDPRIHGHERGWVLHHQLNHRGEESRAHIPVAARLTDHFIVDGTVVNLPIGNSNVSDANQIPANYVQREDTRYVRAGHELGHVRAGHELGHEGFYDQAAAAGLHVHAPIIEERPVWYGSVPYAYGTDNMCQGPHGHIPVHSNTWRNVQHPVHGAPSYDIPSSVHQTNGTVNPGYFRGVVDGSPRISLGADNQNLWAESSQKIVGFNGSLMPENPYGHALRLNQNTHIPEIQHPVIPGPSQSSPDLISLASPDDTLKLSDPSSSMIDDGVVASNGSAYNLEQKNSTDGNGAAAIEIRGIPGEEVATLKEKAEISDMQSIPWLEKEKNTNTTHDAESLKSLNPHCLKPADEFHGIEELAKKDTSAPLKDAELSCNHVSFIPELIASVKKVALENAVEVTGVEEETDAALLDGSTAKEVTQDELASPGVNGDREAGSDSDNVNFSKIEPTKAEEEAISRGLQTIKNDDLEEFRELGSGTYGAVYHGKWRGSDVAIKRIKASCFAGRPSERERLIADFWKEALILSSLHHPNVVSFYGIVRDGPDGSLATVTEFMINGSLKQFLQKKDRTIDRRKRLIIAMDSAFGMEYLHGKNIVHFDLKCENLLVNMRDPHRPICKIGDLGLSKVKQHTLVSGGVRGTLPWMAPELLSGKTNMVSEKIDVYSFGIVMWELLTGDEPYADMHCASIIGGIVNNMLRPKIPTWCDPEWKALMESCWASDPSKRPSFSEISQKLRSMAAAMNLK